MVRLRSNKVDDEWIPFRKGTWALVDEGGQDHFLNDGLRKYEARFRTNGKKSSERAA